MFTTKYFFKYLQCFVSFGAQYIYVCVSVGRDFEDKYSSFLFTTFEIACAKQNDLYGSHCPVFVTCSSCMYLPGSFMF